MLAKYPKHWMARCALAHHSLQVRRDVALAERTLEQLPDPEDPAAHLNLGGVLYALRLSDALGRDASKLRRLIVRRIVPVTRTAAAAGAPPGVKTQLLACYLEPFADPVAVGELAGFWAAADKLAEDAVNEATAAGDVPVLIRLAELGPRMRLALAALRVDDPSRFTDALFRTHLKSIDDRMRRAWEAVREKAPDRPESYRGLALVETDPAKAVRLLLDGLAACGDRSELLEPLVALVARHGTDDSIRSIADALLRSAAEAKTDPAKWCLAATACEVVGRPDVALAACAEARAIAPDHPRACAAEARLRVRTGDFFGAAESLVPLGATVYANPVLARLRGRVVVGTGLWVLRDEEFRKVTDAQGKLRAKTSAPAVGFLIGVFEAPPEAERAAWVAAKAEAVQAADADAPLAGRLRAEALYRLAELSAVTNPKGAGLPPVWDATKVAAALRAFEQLPFEERAEVSAVAAVAALQLKGQGEPVAALRTATPLLTVEASLGTAQLEALGAVLVANGKPADAVRVLERAVRLPRPPAGCRLALAVAYLKTNRPIEARAELARAEATADRSAREQAELVAAKILLQRENP